MVELNGHKGSLHHKRKGTKNPGSYFDAGTRGFWRVSSKPSPRPWLN